MLNSYLERKNAVIPDVPPPFFFAQFFIAKHDSMEHLFGQFRSAVQTVSPPNFLSTPRLLTGEVM